MRHSTYVGAYADEQGHDGLTNPPGPEVLIVGRRLCQAASDAGVHLILTP